MVTVRDPADTRLFIELSSYGSDLSEARHALDLAIQGDEEGYPYADARAYLIGFVVVAYCRTILRSNVRGRITDHIDIPAELIGIHEQVKTFRNATIAHSQSELSVTSLLGQQQGRRAGSPPQRGAARLRDLKAPQSGSSLGRTTASTSAPLRITVTSIRCPIASANRRFCND